MKLTYRTKSGNIATAETVIVAPSTPANIRKGARVYRVTQFCLVGETRGWRLMSREYRTLAGLVRAARTRKIALA